MNTWIAPTSWLLRIVMLWTWVYKYLSPCFPFFWKFIPRNGIVGSYGSSMFNFFRNIKFSSEVSRGHVKIGNNKIHDSQCLPSKCRSVVCETRKTLLSPLGLHGEGTLQCSEPHDLWQKPAVRLWGGWWEHRLRNEAEWSRLGVGLPPLRMQIPKKKMISRGEKNEGTYPGEKDVSFEKASGHFAI